jgi:hypothetical protein
MANFYSNLNLKRNQLQYPVVHTSGSTPSGVNIEGQLYYDNTAGNEMLYLNTETSDPGVWKPIWNITSGATAGGVTITTGVGGQLSSTVGLNFTATGTGLALSTSSLEDVDLMAIYDDNVAAHKHITLGTLKTYAQTGISNNVSTQLSTGTVDGSTYGITSDGGTDDVIIAAATTSAAGVLTSAKFDEIAANTLKNTNVSTALSTGTVDGSTYGITSDGGTDDVIIAAATTSAAGVLTSAKFDEIAANTLKNTNVSTALSTGTVDGSTYGITSDGGTDDVIIAAATTSAAGVLTSAKFDEIAANTLKNTNVSTALSTGTVDGSTYGITSDGGTDDVIIAAATTSAAGVMTSAMFDDNALISNKANKASPAFTGDSTHSDASPSYTMTTTSDNALGGVFTFIKDPVTAGDAADDDSIGQFAFKGLNLSDVSHTYGKIEAFTTSTVDDAERGQIDMSVMAGGAETVGLSIVGDATASRVNVLIGQDSDSLTTIKGNLTVSGTTTTINTNEINLADNIILLNSDWGADVAPTEDAGIHVYRGDPGETNGEIAPKLQYTQGSGDGGKWQMDQGGGGGLVDIGSSADTMGSGFSIGVDTNTTPTTIVESETLTFTGGAGISTETTADGTITFTNTSPNIVEDQTMGSGFSIGVDTNTTPTTIIESETLTFTGGAGISTETTADGTITFTNTSPNIVEDQTMGSGFSIGVDTNTTPTTITESETLTFTGGAGISTETTADGTITFTNTSPNIVEDQTMGSGFSIGVDTNTTPTTIIESETLTFTGGVGISTETTADGTITITNDVLDSGNTQLTSEKAIIVQASLVTNLNVTITHGLNSQDLSVTLWEDVGSGDYEQVYATTKTTDTSTLVVDLDTTPTGDVTVLMTKMSDATLISAGSDIVYS